MNHYHHLQDEKLESSITSFNNTPYYQNISIWFCWVILKIVSNGNRLQCILQYILRSKHVMNLHLKTKRKLSNINTMKESTFNIIMLLLDPIIDVLSIINANTFFSLIIIENECWTPMDTKLYNHLTLLSSLMSKSFFMKSLDRIEANNFGGAKLHILLTLPIIYCSKPTNDIHHGLQYLLICNPHKCSFHWNDHLKKLTHKQYLISMTYILEHPGSIIHRKYIMV